MIRLATEVQLSSPDAQKKKLGSLPPVREGPGGADGLSARDRLLVETTAKVVAAQMGGGGACAPGLSGQIGEWKPSVGNVGLPAGGGGAQANESQLAQLLQLQGQQFKTLTKSLAELGAAQAAQGVAAQEQAARLDNALADLEWLTRNAQEQAAASSEGSVTV